MFNFLEIVSLFNVKKLSVCFLVTGFAFGIAVQADSTINTVSFNRDIRPIFSETCFNCHGPDKHSREAGLRLDIAAEAYATREGGMVAITPGDLAKSEAWQRIITTDAEKLMPPTDSHMVITDAQKALIKQWILQGAKYQKHWAFIAPEKSPLPKIDNSSWANNDIDAFVFDKLRDEGLTPSVQANRRTLIRRLSYDLTGLPPTVEEVHAFVEDSSEHAYETLVDRLLGSVHYGERMAVSWLDQARYADTHGYSRDGGRSMWLWRDWVIQAYNSDMGFDQFLREQIAGDLLPEATDHQKMATGFSRNHMVTAEAGTINEENLTNYCVDRVKTTGEVFLGLTMACAQCHDHKFDPITQKDYFKFFAYFNELSDKGTDGASGRTAKPHIKATTPLKHNDVDVIKSKIAEAQALLKKSYPDLQRAWETSAQQTIAKAGIGFNKWLLTPLTANNPNSGPAEIMSDGSLFAKGKVRFYNIAFKLPHDVTDDITGIRIEFYPHEKVNKGKLGHGKDTGAFGVTAVTVSADQIPVPDVDLNHKIALKTATASTSHKDHAPVNVLIPSRFDCWSPAGDYTTQAHLTVQFESPLPVKDAPFITVMFNYQKLGSPGHFKCFVITGNDTDINYNKKIVTILGVARDVRTIEQKQKLASYHVQVDPALSHLHVAHGNLKRRLNEMTQAHHVQVMDTAKKPRKTHILIRGDYANKGEEVTPGVPAFLPALPEGAPANRLALADWFLSPAHPLTSRVAVNRLWQMLFAHGIVGTSADFGNQSEWPSHPELLDNLAVRFREHGNGWEIKAMMKYMVMSNTYRQSSVINQQAKRVDPANRWFAYGPRFRLQSEFIRDGALAVSGLLNKWVGGASVRPYQPDGLWRELSHYGSVKDTTQVFVGDHGVNLYRRSMYTTWKRTVPPPTMAVFDAPTRELCMMQRESTNTPLQALVLLNDPQYVEAARALAQHVMVAMPEATLQKQLSYAFETVISREPKQAEFVRLATSYKEQLDYYQNNQLAANELLSIGESKRSIQIDQAKHAALMCTVQLMMNLSETITRG